MLQLLKQRHTIHMTKACPVLIPEQAISFRVRPSLHSSAAAADTLTHQVHLYVSHNSNAEPLRAVVLVEEGLHLPPPQPRQVSGVANDRAAVVISHGLCRKALLEFAHGGVVHPHAPLLKHHTLLTVQLSENGSLWDTQLNGQCLVILCDVMEGDRADIAGHLDSANLSQAVQHCSQLDKSIGNPQTRLVIMTGDGTNCLGCQFRPPLLCCTYTSDSTTSNPWQLLE